MSYFDWLEDMKIQEMQERIDELEAANTELTSGLEKLSYFTDTHAKGRLGRFLTVDEIMQEWMARVTNFDEEIEHLEQHNKLLRAVASQAELTLNLFDSWESVADNEAIDVSEFYRYADKYQAAIDGGALDDSND